MIKLSGNVADFQWSTNEQVWPFEKGDAGQTLYCRKYVTTINGSGDSGVTTDIPGANYFRVWVVQRTSQYPSVTDHAQVYTGDNFLGSSAGSYWGSKGGTVELKAIYWKN